MSVVFTHHSRLDGVLRPDHANPLHDAAVLARGQIRIRRLPGYIDRDLLMEDTGRPGRESAGLAHRAGPASGQESCWRIGLPREQTTVVFARDLHAAPPGLPAVSPSSHVGYRHGADPSFRILAGRPTTLLTSASASAQ